MKSTKPPQISGLGSSIVGDNPSILRDVLKRDGVDGAGAVQAYEDALRAAPDDWLQKRLRVLWKSSTPAASLDAKAWLHETGRLLRDLPLDILAEAIDEAVKRSLRGFMPTVGEIRAIAEPRVADRRRCLAQLRAAVFGPLGRPRYPWEPEEREIAEEERCSPEDAQAIMRRFRIGAADGAPA